MTAFVILACIFLFVLLWSLDVASFYRRWKMMRIYTQQFERKRSEKNDD